MDSPAPAIGIDLGTTYSCVGVFQNGKVEIIANDQGNRITPSYVAFTDVEILIGDAAKNQATKNRHNTIFDVKRLMGREFNDADVQADTGHWPFAVTSCENKARVKVEYQGSRTYSPEQISAMILQKMKETAEAYIGKPVEKAVITVPAYYNDSQRGATIDAATIAGLNVLRIINEPTAAAIAYGLEKKNSDAQNVLIFDLGGGTFDVSVLTLQNGVFEVISTAGDTHLGGEDFDNKMVDYFVKEFKRLHKKDLLQNQKALSRLRTKCEQAKRILSSATVAEIELESLEGGIDFYSSITRARFEGLNIELFEKTMDLVKKAIEDAKIKKTQINEVVLVGGSSRIPKIQSMLRDFFGGKELNKSINPDEAVAYGAAIQAAILNGDKSDVVKNLLLLDVTPLSLGTGVTVNEEVMMDVLIKRNTPVPARQTKEFVTLYDNQAEVLIDVYEGEYPKAKDNHMLGEFLLSGITPARARKVDIVVTFEINANGILNVTAVERSTTNSKQITITYNNGRLSKDEIKSMMKEAEKCRANDKKNKDVSSAKNALESYCVDMKSTLEGEKLKNKIDKSDKESMIKKCDETLLWINSNKSSEKEPFEQKHEELRNVFDFILSIARYEGEIKDKYLELLNVAQDASKREIKKAHRDVASRFHPDKYRGDKEIANLYWLTYMKAQDTLISLVNPAKRRKVK
ncbi:heat shock 70 kDa protein II-like [Planococcus citri]|uniref:heat shock 70 kDa protein II-like n=1 Tax=Planococcus citri TaxID=170843 RepID=UPI0031F93D0E